MKKDDGRKEKIFDGSVLAQRDPFRIEISYAGEGLSGDYEPSDPDDRPLLRFTISRLASDGEWDTDDDASFCSSLSARLSREKIEHAAGLALDFLQRNDSAGKSLRRLGGELSWMNFSTHV